MKQSKEFIIPTVARALAQFVTLLTFFYLPLYLVQLGFSGFQIGVAFSIQGVAGFFFAFPIGLSNDKFSSRKIALIGIGLLVLFYFGMVFLKSFYILLLLFLVSSFGGSAFQQSTDTYVIRNAKNKKKGREFSIYFALRQTGAFLGLICGGMLLYKFDFSLLFLLSAIISVGIFVLTLSIKKEASYKFELIDYKSELFKPYILLFMIVVVMYAFHFGAENTSYGLFLKNNLGLTTAGMGWYMGLALSAMMFGGLALSNKLDKTKSLLKYLVFGLVASGISHILMVIPNLYISFAFRLFHEFGDTAVLILLMLYLRRFFSKEKIGGANGALLLATTFGAIMGSMVCGPLGESFGYEWPLILSGIIAIIAVIPALWHRKLEKKVNKNK